MSTTGSVAIGKSPFLRESEKEASMALHWWNQTLPHNSTCAVCGDDDIHAYAGKLNCLVADSEGCDKICNSLGLNLDRDRRNKVTISSTDASLA